MYIGYGNPSTILENNTLPENIIKNIGTPDVILSYYCEGRKLFLPHNVVEFAELEQMKGKQLDANCVETLIYSLANIEQIQSIFVDEYSNAIGI